MKKDDWAEPEATRIAKRIERKQERATYARIYFAYFLTCMVLIVLIAIADAYFEFPDWLRLGLFVPTLSAAVVSFGGFMFTFERPKQGDYL